MSDGVWLSHLLGQAGQSTTTDIVLALQRKAGNEAVAALLAAPHTGLQVQRCGPIPCDCADEGHADSPTSIQRAPADATIPGKARRRGPRGHGPLTSPRFAGDARLEACAADTGRLGQGDRGTSVEKIQQALADLGYGGGKVDGKYGPHTAAAVRTFKKDNRLGFEQFGDVGPGTMNRLDELFPSETPQFCKTPTLPQDIEGGSPESNPVVQTEPAPASQVADPTLDPEGLRCVAPPPAPGPIPAPPQPAPLVVPGTGPTPGSQPTVPTPNFVRDPGCPITAPNLPLVPTPLAFTPDPKHALPPKEEAPDLSMIKDSEDFWGRKDAQDFATGLADCYVARTASNPKPTDRDAKVAELTSDFDQVVRASFARHPEFGVAWPVTKLLAAILTRRRSNIAAKLQAANNARKKADRVSKDQLDALLEERMQPERHQLVEDVRQAVEVGVWGWMAERREKLDFDTIKQTFKGKPAKLTDILSDADQRDLVHGILVDAKGELKPEETQKALDAAQAAKDAAAKKKKQPSTPLTDEEKAVAIGSAESARLQQLISKGKVKGGELRTRRIKARTAKEAPDLVFPEDVKVKGWDRSDKKRTRIHKDVVTILQALESEFPAGFSAGTYTGSIEGDHASSGFEGRFRSVDIYPNGGLKKTGNKAFDQIFGFGFFDQQVAFTFALAIDRACGSSGASFQILYNDFVVVREANKVIQNGRMFNVDNVTGEGANLNLNWHGPLVTHFHVDFAT